MRWWAWAEVAGSLAAGAAAARGAYSLARRRPPSQLMKRNVNGKQVPVVLGVPVAMGGLAGLAVYSVIQWDAVLVGSVVSIGIMALAGRWDDMRGDERSRGFSGHLKAAGSGRLTGGLVKLLAGGVAGAIAGFALTTRGRFDVLLVLETALLVALSANLVNLLDRAPGRAAKVAVILWLPLVAFGSVAWAHASLGLLAGLVALIAEDLSEEGMLGDAGANPLGAMLGFGIAASGSAPVRWGAIGALVLLNAASERWSFSRAIESTPWLRAIDLSGRDKRAD